MDNFDKLPENDKQKIMLAVDALCYNNPQLPAQLSKLADIKKSTPLIWKMMLAKLGV